MLIAFLQQIRQIEIIPVKMYQMGKRRGKGKKCFKNILFFFIIVGKPLFDIPLAVTTVRRTDQIEA